MSQESLVRYSNSDMSLTLVFLFSMPTLLFQDATDRFLGRTPFGINVTLRQFWPDLELSLQIAEDLFHTGILSAQRG